MIDGVVSSGTAVAAPIRRVVEPFVYFPDHASAIFGLGGKTRGPNPNYCFHTNYFEYIPGVVIFHIILRNASATRGELEVRVHGYRPDNPDLGIKLVTGSRLDLTGLEADVQQIAVRISAIPGVHYAVFGHYTEPADLRASAIEIEAEEFGGEVAEDYGEGNVPDIDIAVGEVESVTALLAAQPATLYMPSSQACTNAQLASPQFLSEWPDVIGDTLSRWRQIYFLQVMQRFGFLRAGATGLLLGDAPATFEQQLSSFDCLIAGRTFEERGDPCKALEGGGHFDFVVCLNASQCAKSCGGMDKLISMALRRLSRRGIGVFVFDYRSTVITAPEDGSVVLNRADIEQLSLRMIGHGSDIAQLAFPSGIAADSVPADPSPFGFVVRR